MATYAIGDIQGCYGALEALLGKIGFSAAQDRLWFVGDLVNRGPQSLEVLRFIKSLGERAIAVLGNHDLHLIAVAAGCAKPDKGDTLTAILEAPDREELIDWLRMRPLAHRDGKTLMIHAGLLPQWSADDVMRLAAEVATALRAASYGDFLAQMYGNQPSSWDQNLEGADRLRVIVNALTRMRFSTEAGEMQLKEKGGIERTPKGFYPWFDTPGRKTADCTVVFGHWSALGYLQRDGVLALDSGCLWGGCLTAVRLEDRQAFQLACAQQAQPKRAQ